MSGGRPSKKGDIDIDKVVKLCLVGCTNKQIAISLGICQKTLYNYMKEDKEFLHTIKENKELADSLIEKSLWERGRGYSHPEEKVFCNNGEIITHETVRHYPPDTAAAFIWLKNRRSQEWRDKKEVDVKGQLDLKSLLSDE